MFAINKRPHRLVG